MAKMNISRLDVRDLVAMREKIDSRIQGLMSDLEDQLESMRAAVGGNSVGNGRKGRKAGRPAASGGRKGQRALRATGLPYRALTAIQGGATTISDITAKLKLNDKKKPQLSVALMSLKKRGDIVSTGRGTYKAG